MKTDFFFKRIHSFTGIGLALFLLIHLWTNAQVAWTVLGENDWFVQSVNTINTLPFLQLVEVTLLALPFLVHGYLGWQLSIRPRYLVLEGEGGIPSLGDLPSNRLYTWQRWTGMALLGLLIWHVWEMRFWKRPIPIPSGGEGAFVPHLVALTEGGSVVVSSLGEGIFRVLREMFQSIWMSILYSSFVLIASYHAARGVFTAGITWGLLIHPKQRERWGICSQLLFALLMGLGSVAIWSLYFFREPT